MNFPLDQYSNASRSLGMNILAYDDALGKLEAEFQALDNFTNRVGKVQGGYLVAMLDDLMGYALGITLPANQFAPTANLNVSFLKSAEPGKLQGRGEVLKRDGQIYYLASKLYNEQGELLASATAKAKLG